MTGRQVIWIAVVFIIVGMMWGDPQPASSSTRQLPLQSVGLNDVDDDNVDNDMPLGAAGYIEMASIQSRVNTILRPPAMRLWWICPTGRELLRERRPTRSIESYWYRFPQSSIEVKYAALLASSADPP